MLFNKNTYRKTNDKKLLHKIGKRWVTVSIAMLALLGGSFAIKSVTTHASVVPNSRQQTVAVKNNLNQQFQQKPQPNNTNPNQNVKASGNNTNTIQSSATDLHNKLVANNIGKTNSVASGSTTQSSGNSSVGSSSANSVSSGSASSSASKTKGLMLDAPAPSKPVSTNSNVVNSESSSVSQPSSVSASSNSASGNGMTTLDLGNSSQQARGWNFVQHGIRNNDYASVNNSGSSSVNNSASGNQTASVSSSDAKSNVASAPINQTNQNSLNSLNAKLKAMGLSNTSVASDTAKRASSNNTTNKPLLKDDAQPDYFSGKVTKTGNDDGLNYKVYANGGVEFTDGTANSDLSNFSVDSIGFNINPDVVNAKAIKFDNNINTSKVTNMSKMFENDSSLQSLTLSSSFNTSKVTNMSGMFSTDTSLQSLTLPSSFDTSNVTNMSGMFNADSDLQSLTLPSSFDTGKVTNMSEMFNSDKNLQSLTLPSSFNTSNVTTMYLMFHGADSLQSLTIQSPNTKLNDRQGPIYLGPPYYKVISNNRRKPYTLATPNDFSKGNIGTFVTTGVPLSVNLSIDYFNSNNKMLSTKSLIDNSANDAIMFSNPSWSNTDTSKINNLANLQSSINQNVPSGYQQDAKITSFGNNQWGPFIDVTVQPTPMNYEIDFDDTTNDNSVGSKSITAPEGATYNIVSDATAKKNGNPKSDITIPAGYEATSNTPKTITIQPGHVSYIAVAKTNPATNDNSADIPVVGHQITFKGNIVLHFQSNSNHDIKDIYIPYSVKTKVDENIKDLLNNGNPTTVVPTDYLNRVIQKFNTSNYSYAHQVNGKDDNGTYYNNVWISPDMAGANDTDAKDKVNGQYDSKTNTYINPDFQLDFNALDPGDKPSDTNSPSNSHNSNSPLNPNNKRHSAATTPTAKGQIPNPWNPKHSDSPFNPSNANSPYDPTSPFNPDNPNSSLNPKNDGGNTNPNDPNSPYNPSNPNSILNPKNSNSPLYPNKSNSPLNTNNNPYQPNDTNNNPWNPNTPDSPLNPKNPNSPLSTKNSANPSSTTNPSNPNNPLTPTNEKKHGNNKKPATKGHNDPSDVPSTPSTNTKPSDSDVSINGKNNGKHNPSVPSHVQNPNKPIDNNKTTKGGKPNPNYNPVLPDKTSDTKNGTNTTPNTPDDNNDTNGKSTDIPDTPDDVNNTFYITINDFNNNQLVRSYQKRVLEGNTGTSFTLNPSDYTTEGYSMDNADKSYTGYVSANGLTTIDKSTPQSSIVWNYNANSHTVPVHYINQKGKDLTPNATITGNTSDVITPSDELPAGYHVNPSDKPYKFGSNASDITFNVSGNQLKDSAKATIHLVFDHDGQKYSSRNVTVSLKGKHIGDSDVIVYPFQYQPTNDTYHEVPFPENPADIKLDASNFDNSGNYTPSNIFTYDATTAPSLVVRYVNVDPNAQSVGKGNDSKGRPIIESDTYSANQLESAPYNLDWVVGNKFTFGVTGSTNKNTVNLIKAPAGYDLDDNAQGFNYQNGIETMTLTNGSTYKGHPAMLLMVGLGATPIHHHVQPKPNKPTNNPSGTSINPNSTSVAPSSKASSASSSVAPSNVSPDIVMPSSNTNSVSSASTSTESSSNVASSVSSASQSNSKASVGSSAVTTHKSNKAKSANSAKPVVHKISKKSVSTKHTESTTPKVRVSKINKVNTEAVSEASNMSMKAVQANSTNSVESGHQVATFEVHKANNNVPYAVASESKSTNESTTNVESVPVNNTSNDKSVTTNSAVAKGIATSHNINNTNTNNAHKLPQTNEASSHSLLVAIVALLAGLSLMGVDLYRKHNN